MDWLVRLAQRRSWKAVLAGLAWIAPFVAFALVFSWPGFWLLLVIPWSIPGLLLIGWGLGGRTSAAP